VSTLLLIDDEPMIRRMIREYAGSEDFRFLEASDGAEAMDILGNEPVDLVVLDITMPKMDGWTTLHEIRRVSNVPVIILTVRSDERDKFFGFELGADDYLVKPFSLRELFLRIKVFLKRSEATGAKFSFQHDNFKVDLDSHNVVIDSKSLRLKPKEYDLLAFFIRNPGKVHSRESLLNAVWGYDYYGDVRTVDTHIKCLRDQLGPYKRHIVTVWGSGYKFEIQP